MEFSAVMQGRQGRLQQWASEKSVLDFPSESKDEIDSEIKEVEALELELNRVPH